VNRRSARKATYFFGAKTCRDLYLTDEMEQFEEKLPGFRYIPAISNSESKDVWCGQRGLITEVVERQMDSNPDREAYLCGSPAMIDACLKVLKAKGIPEDRIFFDKFV
jgi:Na+-transporting NADH:ubiquinone oxidoreductase subunit F